MRLPISIGFLRLGWVLQWRSKTPYKSSREVSPVTPEASPVSWHVPARKIYGESCNPWFAGSLTAGLVVEDRMRYFYRMRVKTRYTPWLHRMRKITAG
jgi:hypothetical protein